ncbi:unnamed protein product [Protopolystoma xenopodis]|uniref:Uncharacterized protein n=1 Tax=Protopolystoma xenopodis TaxID=117903 RepID=A0A448XMI9_9PLAT|nr:unnamed protein product [Protopolystoma xenopodis]
MLVLVNLITNSNTSMPPSIKDFNSSSMGELGDTTKPLSISTREHLVLGLLSLKDTSSGYLPDQIDATTTSDSNYKINEQSLAVPEDKRLDMLAEALKLSLEGKPFPFITNKCTALLLKLIGY